MPNNTDMKDGQIEMLNLSGTKYEDTVYICASCSGEFKTPQELEKHWIEQGIDDNRKTVQIIRSAIKVLEHESDKLEYPFSEWNDRTIERQKKFLNRLLRYVKDLSK